jgi:carbon-monoxide dehydrogenase medium subunit
VKPPPFDYAAPETLDEALALLAEHGDEAQPLAGGQSLLPMLSLRLSRPGLVVDLGRIGELKGIQATPGEIRLGAMTRQVEVLKSGKIAAHLPALAAATGLVGHYQTRNRGTIGGSISLGDPAAENPAFALALDAELELVSSRGTRIIRTRDFYDGPYMTSRADDELLSAITYRPAAHARIGVDEIAVRRGDFALAGLVAYIEERGGVIETARMAWFGMGPQPLRAPAVEAALRGARPVELDLAGLAELALQDTDPPDDGHATADYRRQVGRTLFRRLLARTLGLTPGLTIKEQLHERT